jgi:hypothetical protein
MKTPQIDWELVKHLHAQLPKPKPKTETQKLIEHLQNMSASNGGLLSLEFYIVQYSLIADKPIKDLWNACIELNIILDPSEGRKAYDSLKGLEWLTSYKSFRHRMYEL